MLRPSYVQAIQRAAQAEPREMSARLEYKQVAAVLGFSVHDIPVLVRARLLEPLAKPLPNATKYFARVQIEALAEDVKWLSEATQAIYQHWAGKNGKKKAAVAESESAAVAEGVALN